MDEVGADTCKFYFDEQEACVEKMTKYEYQSLLVVLVSRMLKVLVWILRHGIEVENEVWCVIDKIDKEIASQLTPTFGIIKKRVQEIMKKKQAGEKIKELKKKLQKLDVESSPIQLVKQ